MNAPAFMEGRLNKLPRKVATPMRDLVRTGLMSERTAETALEAHELVGEPQHLLGFAIASLEFHLQGVPVHDTIRMARQQGTRINLRWSAKRWQAEHNRLSRIQTLRTLQAHNRTYELGHYARHLPSRWCGYLVRTSRRLGLEGLRQRHCVAVYHEQIVDGRCAIATVFVGQARWTVELQRTDSAAQPLRIAQIRGRYNCKPSDDQRQAVHEELGIPPEKKPNRSATGQADPDRRYLGNLERILPLLRETGVVHLQVEFAGGNGTGGLQRIRPRPAFETRGVTVPCEITQADVCDRHGLEPGLQEVPLDVALEEITYDHLGETDANWIDHQGGEGSVVIDVQQGKVNAQVLVNEVETRSAFYRDTDIATGEILYEI